MDYQTFFKGKKITVIGLGVLGRGIGDIRFLAEQGAELIVTDLKSEEALQESLDQLSNLSGVTYHLGGHQMADFENRDLILKASGVPLDSPYIAHARAEKIPIVMSIALFAKFFSGPLIGITGTLGKTSTTYLIEHILKTAGVPVFMGGNVQGGSTLAMLPTLSNDTVAVLELDSWTLQGFGEEKISPHIAVFTTFLPDHMNYYQGDMQQYFADKAHIFLHQNPEDTLVCGSEVAALIKKEYGREVRAKVLVADEKALPKSWKLLTPGKHMRENAACAALAARAYGIEEEVLKEAILSFRGVPGRLEFVKEIDGIRFYNDTAATTPTAAASGLSALDPEGVQNLIAIVGGADKTLDPLLLAEALKAHAKAIIALPGEGTEKLLIHLSDTAVHRAPDLVEAMKTARRFAQSGDIITLSPGFASFGIFKNMYDRGDQFAALIA